MTVSHLGSSTTHPSILRKYPGEHPLTQSERQNFGESNITGGLQSSSGLGGGGYLNAKLQNLRL